MSIAIPSSTPKQTMPEHPDLWPWVLRVGLVVLSLAWLVGTLWAEPLTQWAQAHQQALTEQGEPDLMRRIGADMVGLIVDPGGWLRWLPIVALAVLLMEVGIAAFIISKVNTVTLSGTRHMFRVRTLNPINRKKVAEVPPADFCAALLSSLAGLGSDRVALTLSRTPNVPATLGVQLRGLAKTAPTLTPERGSASWVRAMPSFLLRDRQSGRGAVRPAPHPDGDRHEPADLTTARRVIEGVLRRTDETAQLDPWSDPFAAVEPGMVIVSQELTLAFSPHWPLRVAERDDGGVLRAMARSLAVPTGVMVQEFQIIPAPVQERGTRRWYALARWWLARMRRRDPLGQGLKPTEEVTNMTRKMGEAHAAVTIRMVAVAQSADPAHVAAARAALDVMRAALAGMENVQKLPLSTVRQRLVPIGDPLVLRVRTPGAALPLALRWLRAVSMLLGALALLSMLALAVTYRTVWQTWLDLPGMVQWGLTVIWGASLISSAGTTFWMLGVLQPWVVLHRVGRRRAATDPVVPFGNLWRQPAVLGSAELGQLWRPPDPQAAAEVAWSPNRILPAPESAFVPEGAADTRDEQGKLTAPQWLTLGHAFDSGGQLRAVGVPLKALHQMMHITAGMGAGKTQAAAAMAAQLIPWGFIVLDGKGDDEGGSLAATILRLLPPAEEHRLFYLNVLETSFPIGLNPIYHYMVAMEQAKSKATRDLAFNSALGLILGLFERLDPGRWGESPGMQQYALMGSHLVLRTGSSQPGEVPTMAKVARALEDETYRQVLIERYPFKHDLIYRFWMEREGALSEAQKTSLSALLRRLDLFMANPITRPMLTVEKPSVDLLEAMEAGRIVIIPMPHRNLGGLGPLVGMLILQSIVAAAYARPGDALSRETAPVFIDEVQVFIVNEQSPDLEQAFTQLRGFGVPLIVLHQTLDQLGALESTFCINAANRMILRTGEPDASTYAKMYSQYGLTPEDIKGMEALHHQYAVTLGPNREQLVFSLRPNPWPMPPAHELPPYIGASRWQYLNTPSDPAATPEEGADTREIELDLASVIYQEVTPAEYDRITGQLAQLPAAYWDVLLEHWDRLRDYHYTYLIEHPGAEPVQLRRQTWLSNLVASRGAIIEEAMILRQELQMLTTARDAVQRMVEQGARQERLTPAPSVIQPGDPAATQTPPAMPRIGISTEAALRGRGLHPDEMPEIAEGFNEEANRRP